MTLNASGPLSMGGSTVGQSINLELGVSATAQGALNDTSFRTLAGVASGQISISNFYGKSNTQGFYFFYYDNSYPTYYRTATGNYRAINKDASGNIIISTVLRSSADGTGVYTVKISSSATAPSITWGIVFLPQATIASFSAPSLEDFTPTSSLLDASGNIYILMKQTGSISGQSSNQIGGIMKLDSTNSYVSGLSWYYQFSIRYGTIRSYSGPSYGSASIDSSNSVYTSLYSYQLWVDGYSGPCCCEQYGSSFFPAVVKITNNPSMGLSRYYRVDWVTPVATGSTPYTNYYYRPNSVTNSSGTTYLIGNIQGGGNYYQSAVALNSSFAVTNQVVFSPNWSQGYGSENGAIALDNAGNIYAGDGSTSFGVLKLNSSLVYQWAYKYSLPVNYSSVSYQGIVVDSSNNFYLCGMATNNTSTYREIIVLKCNSSGVLQWARRISNSNYHLYNPSMVLISDNTLGLSIGAPNGQNNNNMPMLYMQYPTSGSYTGSKSVLLSTPAYTYAMDISTISLSTTSVGASTTVSSSVNSTSVGPTAGTVTPNQSGGSFVSTTATGGF